MYSREIMSSHPLISNRLVINTIVLNKQRQVVPSRMENFADYDDEIEESEIMLMALWYCSTVVVPWMSRRQNFRYHDPI